jgi:hypothetical protein
MRRPLTAAALILAALPAAGSDRVAGAATAFTSPNAVAEACIRIAPMPGAVYSEADRAAEAAFCAVDLYAPDVGLCPKTWSTSPGMILHDLSEGPYAGDRRGFETNACPQGKEAKEASAGEIAKWKPTMNARGTSGTFSPSPLLYYHLSRYFGMDIGVPVAVWRSMDRQMHLAEVARPGLAISGHSHSSDMNREGWHVLVEADEEPASYSPTDELFTADRSAIYGVMLRSKGDRYNSEVNGTRVSGWGKGQNLDFQRTAPFLALRAGGSFAEAIAAGTAEALRDGQIARDMGADVAPQQVAFWMEDLTGIVLLDYILSQQDRVGNIDFVPVWVWTEGGEIRTAPAAKHGDDAPPAPGALRIKRTHLNDNDAGGRVEYANFAKSTGMLEGLRRLPPATYARLMELRADLDAEGPLHAYLRDSFGLSEAQFAQLVNNTRLAADLLSTACAEGTLALDLDATAYLITGAVAPAAMDCTGRTQ